MSSTSEEENEEERAKLQAAIDPALQKQLETKILKDKKSGEATSSKTVTDDPVDVDEEKMAQRFSSSSPLMCESIVNKIFFTEQSFPKPYSLNVTPETQNFIAKKLSKALEKRLEDEVVVVANNGLNHQDCDEDGIYLLSSSQKRISSQDIMQQGSPGCSQKQKKPIIKRRHIEDSDEEYKDEYEKLRSVAVTAQWLTQTALYY